MGICAADWRRNPLFRLLAFLDNTGTQYFNLREEVTSDGTFTRAATVFASTSVVNAILEAGLVAFRENIVRCFATEEERAAFLAIIGVRGVESLLEPLHTAAAAATTTEEETCVATLSPLIDASAAETMRMMKVEPGAHIEKQDEEPSFLVHRAENGLQNTSKAMKTELPVTTEWCEDILCPHSLSDFVDSIESGFPLYLLTRLQEVLRIPSSSTCTDSPLVEQFLVDALDAWVNSLEAAELDRIILACGVQPSVLEVARARKAEMPNALADFLIDVVFPPLLRSDQDGDEDEGKERHNCGATAGAEPEVLDWLLLSYEKNRESIDVEDASLLEAPSKRRRDDAGTEGEGKTADTVNKNDDGVVLIDDTTQPQENEGDILLTADNIDQYMREHPELVPREVIREKRKSWRDDSITEFELEHHYSAAELRSAMQELIHLLDAGDDTSSSAELRKKAKRATRKAEFIQVLLSAHSTVLGGIAQRGAELSSEGSGCGSTQEEEGEE